MKVRVDPGVLDAASDARRREIRQALFDLNAEEDGQPPRISVGLADGGGGVAFTVDQIADGPRRVEVAGRRLTSAFRDYREIIVRLARSDGGAFGMRDIETLDYAKKLVHDEAGDELQRALRSSVEVAHGTARRLFTLVFLVASDLPEALIRGHRRHGPPER